VQAALLEAMQEKQVTLGGETFYLGEPFLVLATQKPDRARGTYPLPEAQLDRFMLKVRVGYPSRDAEKEIVGRMAGGRPIEVQRIAEADDILAARSAIAELFMDQKVVDYIVDVVRATREPARGSAGAEAVDRLRRLAARVDLSGAGGTRARLPARPGLRLPETSRRWRPTCCGTGAPDVRGRGGRRRHRPRHLSKILEAVGVP